MKFYEATFFCREPVYCHVKHNNKDSVWPVMVTINTSIDNRYNDPQVTFFLKDLTQLIAFKNSVVGAVDAALKVEAQYAALRYMRR